MAHSASRVGETAPQVRQRRRRDVRFPTATVDLRRTVAGGDNALAWMSQAWGLRRLSSPLARWSRRLIVHIHTVHCQAFSSPTGEPFDMLQLWISNGAAEDVKAVQCQTRWAMDAPLLNVKTDLGLWLRISPFEDVQHLGEVAGEVDLPTTSGAGREGMQYLGLAVKYPDDEHAYVVTHDSYRTFVQEDGTWRCPSAALAPGRHELDIAFRGADGRGALVRLRVLNLGRGGPLRTEVIAGQLVR